MGNDTPSPATQDASPAPAASATPNAAPQAPATGAEAMVPSWRLRETREAVERQANERMQQHIQTMKSQYDGELQRVKAQLQALVGVTPQNQSEEDVVRQQFAKIFPSLAKLESKYGDLEKLMERAGDLDSQTNHYWSSYAGQQMDKLFRLAEGSMGGQLPVESKRMLHQTFTGFVQSSPELVARYESDPTLVDDFWRAFQSGFIDPARRANVANAANRAPQGFVQDTPASGIVSSPADKPKDLDELGRMAFARFNQVRNE